MNVYHKYSLTLLLIIFGFSNITGIFAATNDADLAAVMRKHNAHGTIIIASENGQQTYIFNAKRAHQGLSSACTFKIASSIALLETGVLQNTSAVLKWDGKKRFLDAWNKDQNLKSAFQSSCVWFDQRLAKK